MYDPEEIEEELKELTLERQRGRKRRAKRVDEYDEEGGLRDRIAAGMKMIHANEED